MARSIARARSSSAPRRSRSPARRVTTCDICTRRVPQSALFARACASHAAYCQECWASYAKVEVLKRPIDAIPCMSPYCNAVLTRPELCALLGDHFIREQLRVSGRNVSEWARRHDVAMCPRCAVVIEKNGGCPMMQCAWCGYDFVWSWSWRFLPRVSAPLQARVASLLLPICWLLSTGIWIRPLVMVAAQQLATISDYRHGYHRAEYGDDVLTHLKLFVGSLMLVFSAGLPLALSFVAPLHVHFGSAFPFADLAWLVASHDLCCLIFLYCFIVMILAGLITECGEQVAQLGFLIVLCLTSACSAALVVAAAWTIHNELPTLLTWAIAALTLCYSLKSGLVVFHARSFFYCARLQVAYYDARNELALWFSDDVVNLVTPRNHDILL